MPGPYIDPDDYFVQVIASKEKAIAELLRQVKAQGAEIERLKAMLQETTNVVPIIPAEGAE